MRFGAELGSIWKRFGVDSVSVWHRFGVGLESFGVDLVPIWNHTRASGPMGSIWERVEIDFGSTWGRFGVGLGLIWGRFDADLESIWDHFGEGDAGQGRGHPGLRLLLKLCLEGPDGRTPQTCALNGNIQSVGHPDHSGPVDEMSVANVSKMLLLT